MAALTLKVPDAAALFALYEEQLAKRRAFVPAECEVEAFAPCELVIEHAGNVHRLAAQVVLVRTEEPGRGVGLSLAALDAAAMEELRVFVFAQTNAVIAAAEEDAGGDEASLAKANVIDKLRRLSSPEQQRLAATGGLSERMALERMYGPNVWETLLRNPRLTIPEVARIARKGTLPRPLVDAVAANASWLAAPEVQRALLSNPRASATVVAKVLRALSRADLVRVPQQTAYPATVRAAAKKFLGSEH